MATDTAGSPRGRPFTRGQSGNPAGKPRGARHKTTLAAEALFDGEVEQLTRKAIELALGGDVAALRICLDRILPPRRERPVLFELPPLQSATDAPGAMAAIVAGVAAAEITLGEAAELAKLVETYIKAIEANVFDQRLHALEMKTGADAAEVEWLRSQLRRAENG